ncbi:hypothetical protein BC826DRAFT_1059331 [Russula brevipes]|nr:hypothetical protein BC826DRAFT_1059331 [Russula brevipes]
MMTVAEADDKVGSPRVNLYALKEKLHGQLTENQDTEPTRVIEFLLLESLPPDDKSVVVRQMLSRSSSVQEVLWNFSRLKGDKRLTLGQNPHFYVDLPTSQEAYQGGFKTDPVEDFRHADKYYVLFDRPGWVFLKFGKKTRAFGNIWTTGRDSVIIFKGS